MNLIIEALSNSVIQLAAFSLIPFICWLIFGKRKSNFFQWIGLKKTTITNKKQLIILLLLHIPLWTVAIIVLSPVMGDSATIVYSKNGISLPVIICILLLSFIQTGLSEEILFRGFIGKRLIQAFGITKGNIIQAMIFGLAHSFIYLSGCGLFITITLVMEAALSAMIIGYINEKICGGSIIPSWLFHAVGNCIPAFIALFVKW